MTFRELFGEARFVAPDTECLYPCLRRCFSLAEPGRAELTVCGLGFFEAEVNGLRVSQDLFVPAASDYAPDPARKCEKDFGEETGHRVFALRYDVTELLRPGENCLGVRLYPGWYHDVCLVFRLAAEDGEGVTVILSNGEARWAESEIREAIFTKGEEQDAAFLREGFSRPDYDASDWRPVRTVPGPDAPFELQEAPADRIIRHIRPTELPGSTPELRLYDAGENITGWPVVRDSCGEARTLTLTMGERFLNGEVAAVQKQIAVYHTDGTPRSYHSRSHWHAFRYFSLAGGAECDDVLVVHANVRPTAEFSCSDPVITWFFDAFLRTQLCNMHGGIPSDCPHLERRGYTGDGQLVCEAAMETLDAESFYRGWIKDISDCQDRRSGHVQYTAPYVHSGGGPGGWGCAIAEVPYRFWKIYGDIAPARELYPQMFRYFDYLDAHSRDGLITSDQPGEWCLGDWCTPGEVRIPAPFVNGFFYLRTVGRVRELALALGHPEDVPALDAKAAALRRVLTERYFDPATGDFCENTQGANAFAVAAGLGDDRTLANTVAHYRGTGHFDCGIFGVDIVTEVLFAHGYAELACTLLGAEDFPSFGYWKSLGATTLWEEWRGDPRSHSHPMFGAAVRHLFSGLLGIRQRAGSAGFADVVISPAFNRRVASARGALATKSGRIEVSYALCGDEADLTVTLAPGVCAVLRHAGEEFPLRSGKNEFILPLE